MKVPKATNPLKNKMATGHKYYKPSKTQPAQDMYKVFNFSLCDTRPRVLTEISSSQDPVWKTPAPQMSVPGSKTVFRCNQNTALHHTALLNLRY